MNRQRNLQEYDASELQGIVIAFFQLPYAGIIQIRFRGCVSPGLSSQNP